MAYKTPTEEFCDPEPPPLLVELFRELAQLWRMLRGRGGGVPVHLRSNEDIDRMEER
jgi:hypothetical protein